MTNSCSLHKMVCKLKVSVLFSAILTAYSFGNRSISKCGLLHSDNISPEDILTYILDQAGFEPQTLQLSSIHADRDISCDVQEHH